jgi:hypothetical protein
LCTGIAAVFLDLILLVLLGVVFSLAVGLWKSRRRRRDMARVVLLLFVCLFFFWRDGGRLSALVWLRTLEASDIAAVRIEATIVDEMKQIDVLVQALNGAAWISPEHGCQGPRRRLVIDLVNGKRKTFWIADNPCAGGTVLNLSDFESGGFYRGAVFSENLGGALEEQEITALLPRE